MESTTNLSTLATLLMKDLVLVRRLSSLAVLLQTFLLHNMCNNQTSLILHFEQAQWQSLTLILCSMTILCGWLVQTKVVAIKKQRLQPLEQLLSRYSVLQYGCGASSYPNQIQ